MRHGDRWMVLGLIVAGLPLSACAQTSADAAVTSEPPAKVERVEGSDLMRVLLTAAAAERLGIQTAPVRDTAGSGTQRTVIPYAAVLYDPNGDTWAYTNPEPLVFVRNPIRVHSIEGHLAVLSDGPPSGTAVVTVGAAELFGAEFGVGH